MNKPVVRGEFFDKLRAGLSDHDWGIMKTNPFSYGWGWRAMPNVFLMVLLAIASSGAMAEWVKVTASSVGTSGDITAYADPIIVPKYSDRVKMWEMHDFKRSASSNTSSKKRVEYDCKKGQARQLQATYYSEGMGRGAVLMSVSDPGQWEPVLPDTLSKKMWKFACKNK